MAKERTKNQLAAIGKLHFSSDKKSLISVDDVNIVELDIPEGVLYIESHAFANCRYLRRITIPSSVTKIGTNAFENCTALEKIVLPPRLSIISANSFRNCRSLTSLTVPEGVYFIGFSAFSNCKALTQIKLPSSVRTIEASAFYSSGLQDVTLPEKVNADYTAFGDTPCFDKLQRKRPDIFRKNFASNEEFIIGFILTIVMIAVFVACHVVE
jgi:hypothetical protein